MIIIVVAIAVIIINIPFGYWRANVKRFSVQWAMAIHIPVLIVIVLRIYTNIGFELYTYPALISAFFLGQYTGYKIYLGRAALNLDQVSSCLVMDIVRKFKS